MGWLLLAAAAVAVFVFAKKEAFRYDVFPIVSVEGQGTVYGFAGYKGAALVHEDNGPYGSEAAAAAAGAAWVAQMVAGIPPNILTPIPDPIDLSPPPEQQGGGGVVLPYLVITSGGLTGSAVVEGDKVRWTAGDESVLSGSVSAANSTLLQRFDTKVPANDDVGIALVRSTGQVVRARVRREPAQAVPWAWEVFIGGASQKRPFWRANNRLAAMRGALTTLQDA